MRTCWERWSWFQRKLKLASCNFVSCALAEQCAMSIIIKCNRDFFAWKLHSRDSLTSCAKRGWNCAFVAQRNGKLFEMQTAEIKWINKVTFNWSLRRFSLGIFMFVSILRIPAWNSCTWGIFFSKTMKAFWTKTLFDTSRWNFSQFSSFISSLLDNNEQKHFVMGTRAFQTFHYFPPRNWWNSH